MPPRLAHDAAIGARFSPTAELRHVRVGDTPLAERDLQRVSAEVRMPPRSGLGADVDESSDTGRAKRVEELLERPRTVTDGPDLHQDQCGRLAE